MESLLSLSFDNLSSKEPGKIRKGLRQLEGLLAQICLSRSAASPQQLDRRRSVATPSSHEKPPKELSQLRDDPAFREFFKLQEGFQWNVALRLVQCLDRSLGKESNGQYDLLIVATLDLLQGILMIHPPSRALFAREIHMNLLLDLLDTGLCPAIHSSALLAVVAALLDCPTNTRLFEALDGLLMVTTLCKARSSSREVKLKAMEFLYFYLMPEAPPAGAGAGDRKSTFSGIGSTRSVSGSVAEEDDEDLRSTEEKQRMLGAYLGNVDDLVEDLRDRVPFRA